MRGRELGGSWGQGERKRCSQRGSTAAQVKLAPTLIHDAIREWGHLCHRVWLIGSISCQSGHRCSSSYPGLYHSWISPLNHQLSHSHPPSCPAKNNTENQAAEFYFLSTVVMGPASSNNTVSSASQMSTYICTDDENRGRGAGGFMGKGKWVSRKMVIQRIVRPPDFACNKG